MKESTREDDDENNDKMIARERGFGTVVEGELSDQELAALDGHETGTALELNNQFGNMLAWFCKVDGWKGDVLAGADYSVNEHLCRTNPEGMFVTVFAAVYDSITGIVQFANAGHMPPLLVGDDVRALDADPGVLLGLFEDAGLENGSVRLAKGEALLMYTDGVTEAVNPDNAFFGEERFMTAVQAHAPYAAAAVLVDEAVGAVDAFAESREQFDDLTLLALVRDSEPVELPVDIASFAAVRERIMATGCDGDLKLKACLACEEALVNVVSYSGANHLWFDAAEEGERALRIVLADDGNAFDPTSVVIDKEFEDLDTGGMGIGLVRKLASDLHYRREADRNILVIVMGAAES